MKRARVLCMSVAIATVLLGGCAAGEGKAERLESEEAVQGQQTEVSLRDEGEDLIALMVEKAGSDEYRSLMTTSEEIGAVLDQIVEEDYEEPQAVGQIEVTESMRTMIYQYAGAEKDLTLSDRLKEDVDKKLVSSMANIINVRYGAMTTLAAVSLINSGSSFRFDGLDQGIIYFYFYEDGYPAMVSFYPEDDGVVSANASFLLNPEWKGMSDTEFQDTLSEAFLGFSLPIKLLEKVEE